MSQSIRGNWVQANWHGWQQAFQIALYLWSLKPFLQTELIASVGVAMVADEGVRPLTLRRFISC